MGTALFRYDSHIQAAQMKKDRVYEPPLVPETTRYPLYPLYAVILGFKHPVACL
jgi:hypothetical protein